MMMKNLVLASASPRRRQMLQELGCAFSVRPASIDEPLHKTGESPAAYVQKIAEMKARAASPSPANALVIGADTVVVYRGRLLGKPRTMEDALAYVRLLNGRVHTVYTGLCVLDTGNGTALRACEKTKVVFRKLTEDEIRQYLARINPLDKAGAYAIQGQGALIVESIEGCYYNVVGFPIARLEQMLLRKKISLFDYMKPAAGTP